MATDVQNGLAEFHAFVGERLQNGGAHLSPEEALAEWSLLHPNDEQHAENVKAIKAALRDMEAGDRGTEMEEHIRRLDEEFSLEGDE